MFGICAFNSDFSDPRTLPYEYITKDNTVAFALTADSTKIQIGYNDYNAPSSRAYYRIYAFEPSNSTADVTPTSTNANKFILNTDYNYCKLYKKGTVSGNANSTITHNLGYIPQMMAWMETEGIIFPINDSDWFNHGVIGDPSGIQLTTTSIVFKYAGRGANNIHYRIYYDQA